MSKDFDRNKISIIEQKVLEAIEAFHMLPQHGRILVGLSGGADSMALTYFLKKHIKQELLAIHIHHGLRKEASQEELFVDNWCKSNQVPFVSFHKNILKLSQNRKIGIEECGRLIRYECFYSLAKEEDRIATAHHVNDSIETFFMNLIRGSGLKGLGGIPPVREKIIRPFIYLSRKDIEQYCEYYSIPFVIDASNVEPIHKRNQIRLEIIPLFKKLNPNFENAMKRFMLQIRQDKDYLDTIAEEKLKESYVNGYYSLQKILKLLPSIRKRMLINAIKKVKQVELTYAHIDKIEQMLQKGNGKVNVPGKVEVRVEQGKVYILKSHSPSLENWKVPLSFPENLTDLGRRFIIRILYNDEYIRNKAKMNHLLYRNILDYDTIKTDTFLRHRQSGDHFRPRGRSINKSLKNLFNEAKIPSFRRGELFMLENNKNIVWIEGFGVAEGYQVTEKTNYMAWIIIEKESE